MNPNFDRNVITPEWLNKLRNAPGDSNTYADGGHVDGHPCPLCGSRVVV